MADRDSLTFDLGPYPLKLGYSGPSSQVYAFSLGRDDESPAQEVAVAEEVPVAIVYNGRPYTVVMATPLDLEDLGVGFSVTEGIISHADALERIEVVRASHGVEIQIELSAGDADRIADRSRTLVTRTSCGLCGIESIKDAIRIPAALGHSLDMSTDALWLAANELSKRQTLNNETHNVHGAAWATMFGEVTLVREDVGRHNALDKLLGALARSSTPVRNGFVVVTSRASYEMVQKAAVCGVELLAAVSRPTGLAIRFAEQTGVTLVGLLRGRSAMVYTHGRRIEHRLT
jgi:FdhD protein